MASDTDIKIGITTTADTAGAEKTTQALTKTTQALKETGNASTALPAKIGPVSASTVTMGNNMGKMGMLANQASYQIGDFFTQVEMGTSPVRAFSQQAPQLLGALSMAGVLSARAAMAFTGIGAAIPLAVMALPYLTQWLGLAGDKAGESGEKAKQAAEKAEAASKKAAEAAKAAALAAEWKQWEEGWKAWVGGLDDESEAIDRQNLKLKANADLKAAMGSAEARLQTAKANRQKAEIDADSGLSADEKIARKAAIDEAQARLGIEREIAKVREEADAAAAALKAANQKTSAAGWAVSAVGARVENKEAQIAPLAKKESDEEARRVREKTDVPRLELTLKQAEAELKEAKKVMERETGRTVRDESAYQAAGDAEAAAYSKRNRAQQKLSGAKDSKISEDEKSRLELLRKELDVAKAEFEKRVQAVHASQIAAGAAAEESRAKSQIAEKTSPLIRAAGDEEAAGRKVTTNRSIDEAKVKALQDKVKALEAKVKESEKGTKDRAQNAIRDLDVNAKAADGAAKPKQAAAMRTMAESIRQAAEDGEITAAELAKLRQQAAASGTAQLDNVAALIAAQQQLLQRATEQRKQIEANTAAIRALQAPRK